MGHSLQNIISQHRFHLAKLYSSMHIARGNGWLFIVSLIRHHFSTFLTNEQPSKNICQFQFPFCSVRFEALICQLPFRFRYHGMLFMDAFKEHIMLGMVGTGAGGFQFPISHNLHLHSVIPANLAHVHRVPKEIFHGFL